MRRSTTLILVCAVGILAALALADALRPEPDSRPSAAPQTKTRAKAPSLLETLRTEAVSGFVLYSDKDCRLHSLLLPRMVDDVVRDEGGSDVFRCRFAVDGGGLVSERQWRGTQDLRVRRGNIVAGDRVLLTHEDLLRAAYRHPNLAGFDRSIPLRIKVTGLTGFGVRSPIVGLQISARFLEPQFLAVVFRGRNVDSVAASFRGPYRNFFLSNDGALAGSEDGSVFTRTGRTIDPPQGIPAGRALAFSPDDRWIAWVNGTSLFLLGAPNDDGLPRIIRLPVHARDLVWRPVTSGTGYGPPIRR